MACNLQSLVESGESGKLPLEFVGFDKFARPLSKLYSTAISENLPLRLCSKMTLGIEGGVGDITYGGEFGTPNFKREESYEEKLRKLRNGNARNWSYTEGRFRKLDLGRMDHVGTLVGTASGVLEGPRDVLQGPRGILSGPYDVLEGVYGIMGPSGPHNNGKNVNVTYGGDARELEVVIDERKKTMVHHSYNLKDSRYSVGAPIAKRRGGVQATPKGGRGILKG